MSHGGCHSSALSDYDSLTRGKVAPPSTNRGVQKTRKGLVAIGCDWCEFTGVEADLQAVKELVPGEWTPREKGWSGYPIAEVNGEATVCYGVRGEVHVILKGRAMNRLRGSAEWDELGFLAKVQKLAKNVSRMDVAVDVFHGSIDLRRLEADWRAGRVATRFKGMTPYQAAVAPGAVELKPNTLYFGSGKSDSMIRAYDKGIEAGTAPEGQHIRIELQRRNENAGLMLAHIVKEGRLSAAVDIMASLLEFKAYKADFNKSRVPMADYWATFLDGAKKAKLAVAKPTLTIERAVQWLHKQVAPIFAAVIEHSGGDLSEVVEMIRGGRERYRPKHRALVANGCAV